MPARRIGANDLLLTIDSGSPTVSVALGRAGGVIAQRTSTEPFASRSLLRLLGACLVEAGIRLQDVDGIVALRGPGSFTGLRVGLATALGLHQALGISATAIPTLPVLAAAAPSSTTGPLLPVVDALRGAWHSQLFSAGTPPVSAESPIRRDLTELLDAGAEALVGFRLASLAEALADAPRAPRLVEPPELATVALRYAVEAGQPLDPGPLAQPVYLGSPVSPARAAGG